MAAGPSRDCDGRVRAEWRPREPECRGPRRGVLSWGQVEKKKEEPTLSVRLLCARPSALCHPQTLHGKRGARYLSGGTCGRGGRSWSPPPALPVPRAQVYATSLEWGLATGAGGRVCTEGPAGWIGGLNRPPPSRARGTPVRPSELPDPGPVPSHPAASRWAKASRGRPRPEAGWRVRWEDEAPAPGQATGPGTRGSGKVWHFLLPKTCVWW